MTPWGPLGAVYTPLVVRFRPGHLSMTHGSPKHSYREPADHLEAVQKGSAKLLAKTGDFGVSLKKPTIMAHMSLQCQDMVPGC